MADPPRITTSFDEFYLAMAIPSIIICLRIIFLIGRCCLERLREVRGVDRESFLLIGEAQRCTRDSHVSLAEDAEHGGAFFCTIRQGTIDKPVIVNTGHSYSQEHLKRHLKYNKKCPNSNQHINKTFPNLTLRELFKAVANKKDNIEEWITCPFTKEPFKQPEVASDGYSYEREILQSGSPLTSPYTNKSLQTDIAIPNLALKKFLANYRSSNASLGPSLSFYDRDSHMSEQVGLRPP